MRTSNHVVALYNKQEHPQQQQQQMYRHQRPRDHHQDEQAIDIMSLHENQRLYRSSSSSLLSIQNRRSSSYTMKLRRNMIPSMILVIVVMMLGTSLRDSTKSSSRSLVAYGQSDYYSSQGGSDGGYYYNNNNNDGGYYSDANDGGSAGSGGYYGDDPMPEDNLYASYAAHQQEKMLAGNPNGGGIGWLKFGIGCSISWYLGGKYHSNRVSKKLKLKFQKEQKQLYTQYYNDVYKLSETNMELSNYVDTLKDTLKQTEAKHELEAIQRDYDEFKQPDIDGDDRISRAEFNMYVKNYLSNYPGLTEADYPKFEDFDHDHDGFVSFQEYSQQMALQAQQAELEQLYGKDSNTKKSKEKSKAYNDMYDNSVGSARTKMYR